MNTGLSVSLPDRPGAAVFTYRREIVYPGLARITADDHRPGTDGLRDSTWRTMRWKVAR